MDRERGGNVAIEVIKEREKFLVAMAWFAQHDDRAIEHIEGREQGGGAVPLVIVGHAFDIRVRQWQSSQS